MVHAVFCLVSALTIMAAVVPLAYAGEMPEGQREYGPKYDIQYHLERPRKHHVE